MNQWFPTIHSYLDWHMYYLLYGYQVTCSFPMMKLTMTRGVIKGKAGKAAALPKCLGRLTLSQSGPGRGEQIMPNHIDFASAKNVHAYDPDDLLRIHSFVIKTEILGFAISAL